MERKWVRGRVSVCNSPGSQHQLCNLSKSQSTNYITRHSLHQLCRLVTGRGDKYICLFLLCPLAHHYMSSLSSKWLPLVKSWVDRKFHRSWLSWLKSKPLIWTPYLPRLVFWSQRVKSIKVSIGLRFTYWQEEMMSYTK